MSCCDTPGLLPVNQAIEQLLSQAKPTEKIETIELEEALGRVLAQDQLSSIEVPAFNNSAMDGYGVKLESLANTNKLKISQRIIAGDPADIPLIEGTCCRIFTGAPVPANCDAVIMQEQCELSGEAGEQFVTFPENVKLEQNIRPKGQDIATGSIVLEKGKTIRAQELGLLASVGIKQIPVYKPLTIAVISTGNEIIAPGKPIKAGQIYNSNHYTLIGLLKAQGFAIYDCGTIIDEAKLIEEALLEAAENADCIITSGGVSVGEEDYVKDIVEKLGRLDLWKMAIKPGKPFAFGYVNETPFIGLPGNPSAVFVTYNIVAKPFLVASQGAVNVQPHSAQLPADFEIKKTAIREQYLYVKAEPNSSGKLCLSLYPNQSSGVLSSSSWASGLAKIPVDTKVKKGDWVEYIPF